MAISYTDSFGPVVDTGSNTQPTARPSVDIEFHGSNEIDSGSKLTTAQLHASHVPHRPANTPR